MCDLISRPLHDRDIEDQNKTNVVKNEQTSMGMCPNIFHLSVNFEFDY